MKYICHIATTILFILSSVLLSAQTVADAWKSMPVDIQPTIDSIARLDMIDLYQAGMAAKSTTLLGDTARLITMSDSYIALRTSKSSTMQIKCIKHKKQEIYAVITTTEGPAANSHMELYNPYWEKLPLEKYFTPPTVDNFIGDKHDHSISFDDIRKEIVIPTIQYMMNDSTNNITFTPTFLYTLDKETRKKIEPYIKTHIRQKWTGRKWK